MFLLSHAINAMASDLRPSFPYFCDPRESCSHMAVIRHIEKSQGCHGIILFEASDGHRGL